MAVSDRFQREVPAPVAALLALVIGPVPVLVFYYRYAPAGTHVTSTLNLLGALLGGTYGALMILLSLRVLRSTTTRVWFGVVLLLGSVLTGPLPLAIVNMRFDHSPPLSYTAQVLEVHPKGKAAARITITHWEAAAPPFTIPGMVSGTELPLVVHQGRLGFPWIEWPEDVRANQRAGVPARR